jgi:hypothetical protein
MARGTRRGCGKATNTLRLINAIAGAGLAVVAVAVVAIALHAHVVSTHDSPGPLRGSGGSVWGYPEEPIGTRFSDGLRELEVVGSNPVTITAVTVIGGDRALSNVGALIGLPGRRWDFAERMNGFPPPSLRPEFRVPAVGAVLEPGADYMLVIGYEVQRHVADRQTAIAVDYTAAGEDYRLMVSAGIEMCPPPTTSYRCLLPAGNR